MRQIAVLLWLLICFCAFQSQAQNGFNYQASIRSTAGQPIGDKAIRVRMNILSGSANGTSVYSETHQATTNTEGIFAVVVGAGTVGSGSFQSITWGISSHFLKVEIDVAGGTNYADFGTTQIQAVPVSYYALSANEKQDLANVLSNGSSANNKIITNVADPSNAQDVATKNYVDVKVGSDSDSSPTNEIQDLSSVLAQGNSGGSKSITNVADPSAAQDVATKNYVDTQLAGDGDKSSTNEIQNLSSVLTESNSAGNKKITNVADPAAAQDVATKNYVDTQLAADGDKSATNEIQDLSSVLTQDNSAGNKKITNVVDPTAAQDVATKNYVDTQLATDADKSATNEIQDLSLQGSTLKITNNSSATSIDLGPFVGTNTDEQDLDNVLTFGNSAGNKKIVDVANPTAAQDAATKNYVDNLASSGWSYSGNSISDPSTQFIGTTNAQPLRFRTNNSEALTISSTGNIGIGVSAPDFRQHVVSGTSTLSLTISPLTSTKFAGLYNDITGGSATGETHFGTFAKIKGTDGGNTAVGGYSHGTSTGTNHGVRGFATGAKTNFGVAGYGVGVNATDQNYAMYGYASGVGTNSIGVFGTAEGTARRKYGVIAYADGDGDGDPQSKNFAIYAGAYSHSIRNTGAYIEADGATAESNWGVISYAKNSPKENTGGYFQAENGGQLRNRGVVGIARDGKWNYAGVFESAGGTDANYGVYSTAINSSPANYGGYFSATGATANTGIFATAPSGAGNWAGYFSGDVNVTGKVSIATVLNLKPRSSAPLSPIAGDIYYDSNTNTVKFWNGTAWKTIQTD